MKIRCLATIGEALRDTGDPENAISHYQRALALATNDKNDQQACWVALPLMLALYEGPGPEAALAFLPAVRRAVVRAGNPVATAALHIFVAELEAKRGLVSSAAEHLRIGRGLLTQRPNAWLEGSAAVGATCLGYLLSDLRTARMEAVLGLTRGEESGHLGVKRAALANLGHIELAEGNFLKAEEHLREALRLSPALGDAQRGIVDGLAQVALAQGIPDEAERLLDGLPAWTPNAPKGSWYYGLWSCVTRVRLLAVRRRFNEASHLLSGAVAGAQRQPDSTLTTSLRLLQAEALVRTRHHARAAVVVAEAAGQAGPAPMDTLAEVNRVAAVALAAAGDLAGAGAAFERAARILATVGNRTARADLLEQYAEAIWPVVRQGSVPFPGRTRRDQLPPPPASVAVRLDAVTRLVPAPCAAASHTAIRAATIVDAGGYPEVLAHEVAGLLLDTGAALAGALTCRPGDAPTEIHAWWGCSWREARALAASPPRRIDFGNWHGRHFEIALRPADGMEAALSLVAAEKLARGARWQDQARRDERERSALWPVEPGGDSDDAIFLSQGMTDLVTSVRRVAPLDVLVLLTGETGTGKEVIARVIHAASGRGTRPFVPFNCTAVPHEMIDSQLFGYRRGAFTGAIADFPGVIRAAAGGTLFLDEIGELGPDVQPKLLRFLESGEVQPLGDPRPTRVQVRVVASTNANLERLVSEGRFREDLYYRLAVVRFPIPPLRERREEIPALAQHFLERAARDFQKKPLSLADESVEYLTLYRWPGNVRQLANEMRRLAALAEKGAVLMPEHLDAAITAGRRTVPAAERSLGDAELVVRLDQPLDAAVEHLERAAILRAIASSGGRVEEAARLLGLSRKGLYLKRQRLGLE